jgi:uncharacterized protein YbjT (DUF2867 family)
MAMHLIVGATGFLGTEICRRLTDGVTVRALVRGSSDPSRVDDLRAMGAKIAVGDLKDPASLDRACHGVRLVISTANTIRSRQQGDTIEATDDEGQRALVEAASRAGASHFVYISLSGNFSGDDPFTTAKRETEAALKASGMSWTILRPSVFMEVWLSPHLGFDFPNAKATIYGSGDQKISWISLADVAEFAVFATGQEAKNEILELGGPEALSPREVVRIFEEVSGRSFELQHVPVEALEERKRSAQDSYEKTFAALMLGLTTGDEIPMERMLRRFPVRLTSVREYAQRVLA